MFRDIDFFERELKNERRGGVKRAGRVIRGLDLLHNAADPNSRIGSMVEKKMISFDTMSLPSFGTTTEATDFIEALRKIN